MKGTGTLIAASFRLHNCCNYHPDDISRVRLHAFFSALLDLRRFSPHVSFSSGIG